MQEFATALCCMLKKRLLGLMLMYRVGMKKAVGGQEDWIIEAAHELSQEKKEQ
jgi:hypothetical protein